MKDENFLLVFLLSFFIFEKRAIYRRSYVCLAESSKELWAFLLNVRNWTDEVMKIFLMYELARMMLINLLLSDNHEDNHRQNRPCKFPWIYLILSLYPCVTLLSVQFVLQSFLPHHNSLIRSHKCQIRLPSRISLLFSFFRCRLALSSHMCDTMRHKKDV